MSKDIKQAFRNAMNELRAIHDAEMNYLQQIQCGMPFDPSKVDPDLKRKIDGLLLKHSKKESTE